MKSYTPKLRGDTCKVGSGGNKYNVGGKRIDEVVLRFDEDEQKFYARIVNPSQHTQYLLSQGRLAIALCKLNTGASTRKAHVWWGRYTHLQYHPRWSRCRDWVTKVTSFNNETEIYYEVGGDLIPQLRHSLNYRDCFTKIKCILISMPEEMVVPYCKTNTGRGYKTYCSCLRMHIVDGDYETCHISIRPEPTGDGERKYQCQLTVSPTNQPDKFHITITNPNNAFLTALANRQVCIGYEMSACGVYAQKGGKLRRFHYGFSNPDDDLTEWDEEEIQHFKRWKFKKNDKFYCPVSSLEEVSTLEFDYILPPLFCDGLGNLPWLMYLHDDHAPLTVPIISIVIKIMRTRDSNSWRVQGPKFGTMARYNLTTSYPRAVYSVWNGGDDYWDWSSSIISL